MIMRYTILKIISIRKLENPSAPYQISESLLDSAIVCLVLPTIIARNVIKVAEQAWPGRRQ